LKKYSLILSDEVAPNTKIRVYELCEDGQSIFQEFIDEVENDGNQIANLASAIRIIEDTANLSTRPKTQFRPLVLKKMNCKVYEAKSGGIRVYLFHEEHTGRVIVTGGLKGDQDKDIKSVVKTIKAYQDEQQTDKKRKNT